MALLVGLLIGTYSSAFFATPLAVEFQSHSKSAPPAEKQRKQKAASPWDRSGRNRADNSGAVV